MKVTHLFESAELLKVAQACLDKLISAAPSGGRPSGRDLEKPEMNGKYAVAGVRAWVMPDDASQEDIDDGDYDFEVLAQSSSELLEKIEASCKKAYPKLKINITTGEKSWIYVQVFT